MLLNMLPFNQAKHRGMAVNAIEISFSFIYSASSILP